MKTVIAIIAIFAIVFKLILSLNETIEKCFYEMDIDSSAHWPPGIIVAGPGAVMHNLSIFNATIYIPPNASNSQLSNISTEMLGGINTYAIRIGSTNFMRIR